MPLPPIDIIQQRIQPQGLAGPPFATPAEVVAWLGAVQAQEYPGGKWALGLRMQAATDCLVDQAYKDGAILRTHVLRPTWHFVTPADIRWMLEMTAPRVNAGNAYMYRQQKLDEQLFDRSSTVIAGALQGGRYLTRAELGMVLTEARIAAEGIRLGYIIMRAELGALICSGPMRGKQFTYALLEERAPQAKQLPHDEALAELTHRYFRGHGPATVRDFSWWSGLTVSEAKSGLELAAADLSHQEIDGQAYWFSEEILPAGQPAPTAFLLPTYDEILVGYDAFNKNRLGHLDASEGYVFNASIMVNGRVVGRWKRILKKDRVEIDVIPFNHLASADLEAIRQAAEQYAQFLGLNLEYAILQAEDR